MEPTMYSTMLGSDSVSSWTTKETEEIQREAEELRRRDEEEILKRRDGARRRIENHLNQHGGDLSLLMRDLPVDMNCIQLSQWGSNDDYVKTARTQVPLPLKNEVLVKSYSCGVLFHDLLTRQGILDSWFRSWKLPFTLGSEVAGEVVGVGRNITDLKPGDRVMALPPRKAWAEYVVCKQDQCFKIPDNMTYNDAVALILDGMVAYSLLFEMGGLKIEDPCGLRATRKNVLMHSSAGGLSDMVVQMLRNVPNTRLFQICLTDEESSGEPADEMIHYIDHDADYVSEIRHVSPRGVDLILDCQHENNFNSNIDLLRPMGKYVLYGTHSTFNEGRGIMNKAKSWFGADKISPLKMYEENKSVCGFNLRSLLYFQHDREYLEDVFCRVIKMWQDGKIRPKIDIVLDFNEFSTALHKMQESGHQKGKIILNPTMMGEFGELPKDYFAQAEKNVNERRRQKQAQEESILPSFSIPKPGELAHDISPEEKAREELERRQQEQADIQRKLMEEQAKIAASQQPMMTVPATMVVETTPQPVVMTQASAVPVVTTTRTIATGVAPTETIPSAPTPSTIIEEERQPVLTREKVELSVPMSKEEAKELIKDMPSKITAEPDTKVYETLRGE